MAEAPFDMPGHRWDPVKKRFFKILPGPPPTQPASAGPSSRPRRPSPPPAKIPPRPRLPALPTGASASKTFSEARWDPVSLRQQARGSVGLPRLREQQRVEAAYSQLVLAHTSRPLRYSRARSIGGLHTDGRQVLVVSDHGQVLSLSERGQPERVLATGSERSEPAHVWSSSTATWIAAFQDGKLQSVRCTPHPNQPSRGSVSFDVPVPTVASMQGTVAWATFSPTQNRDGYATVFAVSIGWKVHVFSIRLSPNRPAKVLRAESGSNKSDVMALAFCTSGDALYTGLRSGVVQCWAFRRCFTSRTAAIPHRVLGGAGSVTHLAAVSDDELVVVRITGQADLVSSHGEARRSFSGHVNSYSFRLGWAVDVRWRVMAIAGLDGKVRIWSLDSPTPLASMDAIKMPKHTQGADDDEMATDLFQSTHAHERSKMARGTPLGRCTFPDQVVALLWLPRSQMAEEPDQVTAQSGFKDLLVGAGEWLYLFAWP